VACARPEAAWLEGDRDRVDEATKASLERALERKAPWAIGELAVWRRRAGLDLDGGELGAQTAEPYALEPYALELAGDRAAAARAWATLGCPYEAALALAEADEQEPLRLALEALQRLDARPAAAIVARRLRERGVPGLPRGPRRPTRENPAGLAPRELEVVALVAEGLRNAEIAERLVLSEKTVDHHVSAILRWDIRADGEERCRQIIAGNGDDVTWLHSYVSEDGRKSFCMYEAPSPEAIRKGAARNDLPIDSITSVRLLDPYPTGRHHHVENDADETVRAARCSRSTSSPGLPSGAPTWTPTPRRSSPSRQPCSETACTSVPGARSGLAETAATRSGTASSVGDGAEGG
jgi:hypothetical protein